MKIVLRQPFKTILLSGCEAWTVRAGDSLKHKVFDHTSACFEFSASRWQHFISNTVVRTRSKIVSSPTKLFSQDDFSDLSMLYVDNPGQILSWGDCRKTTPATQKKKKKVGGSGLSEQLKTCHKTSSRCFWRSDGNPDCLAHWFNCILRPSLVSFRSGCARFVWRSLINRS